MSGFVISVDRNQKQVMMDLAHMGIQSRSVAGARMAGFDIVCCCQEINLLVELKQKGKRNDLRQSETWMKDYWTGPFIVAETAEEIREWYEQHALGNS